jgi:hypothetical protein
MTSPETSLATIQSARFAARLATALATTSSVSAAKPTSRRGRFALALSSARMSRVGVKLRLSRPLDFLSLRLDV